VSVGLTTPVDLVRRSGPGRRRRRGGDRRRFPVVAVVLALVLVLGAAGFGALEAKRWYANRFGTGEDYAGPGTGKAVVQVRSGDTAGRIARTLEAQGVVRSARAFVTATRSEPRAQQLQPGFYELRARMKAATALALMLDPASRVGVVAVPEGLWAREVLDLLSQRGGIPRTELAAASYRPRELGLPAYANGRLEGFLYPSRYDIHDATDARTALREMVARFRAEAAALRLEERAAALGMSPYQVLIVASLVQAEARHPQDFGKVSRVIYNRLGGRFEWERRLQFDSTVNYARKTRQLRLSLREIEALRSPYNTYTRTGLPPTPVDNPGRAAIEAALAPTPGDWRYFVTVNPATGETRFTADYRQFLVWKEEFRKSRP
jgi:UPF0755 protein